MKIFASIFLVLIVGCASLTTPTHLAGPKGYIVKHLYSTNGWDVDALTPTKQVKAPMPAPAPVKPNLNKGKRVLAEQAKFVPPPAPLHIIVPPDYLHKETTGAPYDVFRFASEGMVSNHVYRFNFSAVALSNGLGTASAIAPPRYPTNWFGYPESSFLWVRWPQDAAPGATRLQFSVTLPTNEPVLPLAHGFFRMEDVSGQ